MPAALERLGGGPRAAVTLARPETTAILHRSLAGADPSLAGPLAGGAIARGMGRSYGDAAQRSGGLVIDTTALRALELDAEHGTVTAQAGATLGELLAAAAPAGWILPTVPGTQHVSLGGAIASDVHGKNHGAVGSFGSHVLALGLLTAAGEVLELTPDQDDDLLAGDDRRHGPDRRDPLGPDQAAPADQPVAGRRHRSRRVARRVARRAVDCPAARIASPGLTCSAAGLCAAWSPAPSTSASGR